MNFPVKRVENRTGKHTRKQKYGTGDSASISNSGDVYENHTAKQTTRTQTKT